jgi:hypothetical protein
MFEEIDDDGAEGEEEEPDDTHCQSMYQDDLQLDLLYN